jgi:spermidine synthase
MPAFPYVLFFFSGVSGLVYQVVWVRVFGNVFGNTVYTASLVVAVFMLGLGVGSYMAGAWADRRYAAHPGRSVSITPTSIDRSSINPLSDPPANLFLRMYAYFELAIGAAALFVSLVLPHFDRFSALVSWYSREPSGWYVLSLVSYLARVAIAVALIAPITILMGGTLTLLIRHLVRREVDVGGRRIAALYGINTAGAALGALLTDFALVPSIGLRGTQMVAVVLNMAIGTGALWMARRLASKVPARVRVKTDPTYKGTATVQLRSPTKRQRLAPSTQRFSDVASATSAVAALNVISSDAPRPDRNTAAIALTSLALAMSGFAAMGMEILWFRHLTILLGQWRAVFSLLLTVILVGVGAGSLLCGSLRRHVPGWLSPVQAVGLLMAIQGLFVASTLLGLAAADAARIGDIVRADPMYRAFSGPTADAMLVVPGGLRRTFSEVWFNLQPILFEVGLPALLMGFGFPLGNAIIQRTELLVGRRAGVLYLSNTAGAVCGSLAAGFLLLPSLGIQNSATLLMIVASAAVVPLYFSSPDLERRTTAGPDRPPDRSVRPTAACIGSALLGALAIGCWYLLPPDYVLTRALSSSTGEERLISVREGLTEVVAVTDVPGKGRRLLTNGHPMSSTTAFAQRYMRALTHIPLLAIERPEAVLVIGFGVGNTTHAATLHPSIRRVDVADLSRDILGSAGYFRDVNGDVLRDRRVGVYVNDGRHHLQMQPPGSYDLVTLEPPPIGYAGVAALYSEEFYALARTRLKPKGYVSQWLPAYQVPGSTTLAMIRAFIDVFPQTVLVSGAEADLLLLGTNDSSIRIDPDRLAAALAGAPAAQADLRRLDLGSVREIVGTFVGSAETLAAATRDARPVSDDRPIQEYGVKSVLNLGEGVPGSIVDLSRCAAWCPACFVDGRPVALAEGLDTYLALLGRAYRASHAEVIRARSLAEQQHRVVAGSAYLGAIVPESADVHNLLGIAVARQGRIDEAIGEFRQSLRLEPDSAMTSWHLGAALASRGEIQEAVELLRRSVRLDPSNAEAGRDLDSLLALDRRR